jgi:hypothetical protein
MHNPTSIRALFSLPASSRLPGSAASSVTATPGPWCNGAEKTARGSQCGHRCRGRHTHRPCPRPFGCRVPPLPPVRAVSGPLPAVPWRLRRAPRLAGEEPTLNSALRPIRGRALPRHDQHPSRNISIYQALGRMLSPGSKTNGCETHWLLLFRTVSVQIHAIKFQVLRSIHR